MPRYRSPASDLGRVVREPVPDEERYENTLPNSSLLFFHIGHNAFDVEGAGDSGLPMCRTTGEGQRQFGPKILGRNHVSG